MCMRMEIMEAFFYLGNIVTITVLSTTLFGTSVAVIFIIVLSVIIWKRNGCCNTKEDSEVVYDDVKTPSQKDLTQTELTQNVAYGYVPKRSTTASM